MIRYLILTCLMIAPTFTGCSGSTVKADAVAIEAGVVTCAKGDVPAAKALGLKLGTEALADLLAGKTWDQIWAHVSADAEAAAKVQGLAVASCGFGDYVAELDKALHSASPTGGSTTSFASVMTPVDPVAGGRDALAAFSAAHQITRIDP